jgi:hypothetical protein
LSGAGLRSVSLSDVYVNVNFPRPTDLRQTSWVDVDMSSVA